MVLLEEDQAERKSLRTLRSQADTLSFSDGSLQLNTKLPFLYGRHSIVDYSNSSEDALETSTCMWLHCSRISSHGLSITGRGISRVHFSQVQRHTMMSVHSPTTKPSAVRLDSCTIICIWNIWEPSRPQKVLIYESEVTITKITINT